MSRRKLGLAPTIVLAACLTATASQAGLAFIVTAPRNAPPVERIEHPGQAPFQDAVWVDGRWDWKNRHYVWVTGHWQRAPNGFHRWQKGEWAQRDGSWVFNPGKWF